MERHLNETVRRLGGETRKLRYVGRAHAPDRLVLLPGRHIMVELKAPDKEARGGQVREHTRLRRSGIEVVVLVGKEEIDAFFAGRS